MKKELTNETKIKLFDKLTKQLSEDWDKRIDDLCDFNAYSREEAEDIARDNLLDDFDNIGYYKIIENYLDALVYGENFKSEDK